MGKGYWWAAAIALAGGCTTGSDDEYVHRAQPTCSDGITNGYETGVDCGGSCDGCPVGYRCLNGTDCMSQVCDSSVCSPPTCTDGLLNGDEVEVDCGGTCGTPCGGGSGGSDGGTLATCNCGYYLVLPQDCPGGVDDDSLPLYEDLFVCYCGSGAMSGPCAMDCAATYCADPPKAPDATCNTCLVNANFNDCKAQADACSNDI